MRDVKKLESQIRSLRAANWKRTKIEPKRSRLDRAADFLERFHLLRAMTAFTGAALALGLYVYSVERQEASEDRLFNSWQLINQSTSGNAGKASALSYLNTRDCWKAVNLAAGEAYFFGFFHASRPVRCLSHFWSDDDLWNSTQSGLDIREAPNFPTQNNRERIALHGLLLGRDEGRQRPYFDGLRLISSMSQGLSIRESDTWAAVFSGLNQNGFDISGSDFTESYFTANDLRVAKFNCTRVKGSLFAGFDAGASLQLSEFKYADFTGAVFTDLDVAGSHDGSYEPMAAFLASFMRRVSISGFDGRDTDYSSSSFRNVTYDERVFRGAIMMGATFKNMTLADSQEGVAVDVSKAFEGTNLSLADLSDFGDIAAGTLASAVYCNELEPPILPESYRGPGPAGLSCVGEGRRGITSWQLKNGRDNPTAHHIYDYSVAVGAPDRSQRLECGIDTYPPPRDSPSVEFFELRDDASQG